MAQRGRPRKQAAPEQVVGVQEQAVLIEEQIERPSVAQPRQARPKRVPVNGYRNILGVEGQDPSFHYAWIRDDLMDRFQSAGYEFVEHAVVVGDRKINAASQIGSKISVPGGNGRTLYLMRQLKEDYDEDMAAYHAEVDAKEAAMYAELNSKKDGRYGEVQITHGSKTQSR